MSAIRRSGSQRSPLGDDVRSPQVRAAAASRGRRVELPCEVRREAVKARLFEGSRVVGDKPAGPGIPAVIAKPPGPIERMEAGLYKLRAVADVVKPPGVA